MNEPIQFRLLAYFCDQHQHCWLISYWAWPRSNSNWLNLSQKEKKKRKKWMQFRTYRSCIALNKISFRKSFGGDLCIRHVKDHHKGETLLLFDNNQWRIFNAGSGEELLLQVKVDLSVQLYSGKTKTRMLSRQCSVYTISMCTWLLYISVDDDDCCY